MTEVAAAKVTDGLMSVSHHLALLRAGAPLIIPALLSAVIVATWISSTLPRSYSASATLYVGQSLTEPSLDYNGLVASQLLTPTYASLATGSDLLTAVAEELELDEDPDILAQRVEADAPAGGTLITIRGTASTPEDAAELSNAVAGELVRQAPAERADQADLELAVEELDADIEATRQTLLELLGQPSLTSRERDTVAQLLQRLEALQSTRASLNEELATRSPNALTLVDQARPPRSPAGPNRTTIVGVAGATSLTIAILLVYAFAGLRRSSHELGAET